MMFELSWTSAFHAPQISVRPLSPAVEPGLRPYVVSAQSWCESTRALDSLGGSIVPYSSRCSMFIRYRSRTRGTGRCKVEIGIRPTDRTLGLMDYTYKVHASASRCCIFSKYWGARVRCCIIGPNFKFNLKIY